MPRLFFVLLFCLAAAPAWAQGFVRADGRQMVGTDGRPFLPRGISLGNWLLPEGYMFKFTASKSPRQIDAVMARILGRAGADAFWDTFRARYVTAADIRFIAAAGFNTVRVPLHHDLFMSGDAMDGPGWALLDDVVRWSRAAGLYVLIDLHAAPGGQTGINHDDGPGLPLMFYVPEHRRRTVALWRAIAARYRDEPAVLGYDLLNEPIAPYHDRAYLNPRLEPFYRELVAAIRAVDPNHMIVLAGAQWSGTFAMLGKPFAPNLAYTYHKFWASTGRDSIQEYLNFSNRHRVPVFVGETGETDDMDWNRAFRDLNERHGFGWLFWTYKNMDTRSTVVSIPRPADWHHVMALGARLPHQWTAQDDPPADAARRALRDYLDALPLARGMVRADYLRSLGLRVPGTE